MQRRIVLFVLAFFAAACSHDSALTGPSTSTTTTTTTPTAGPSTLSGKVIDQITQSPIAAAALTLADPAGVNPTLTASADSGGAFSFANVTAGTYLLQTVAKGYSDSDAGITVPVGALTVQMLRNGVQPALPLLVNIGGPSTIKVGQSVQLTAAVVYTDGSRADVTNVAKWASTSTAEASVSTSGLLTGFSAGADAVITATIEGVGGSLPVTVVAR